MARQGRFAFSVHEDGNVSFVGEIVGETETHLTLNVLNIISWWAGWWDVADEFRTIPKSACRRFRTRAECSKTAMKIANSFVTWKD